MMDRERVWKYMRVLKVLVVISTLVFLVIGLYWQIRLFLEKDELRGCKGPEFMMIESVNVFLLLVFLFVIIKV